MAGRIGAVVRIVHGQEVPWPALTDGPPRSLSADLLTEVAQPVEQWVDHEVERARVQILCRTGLVSGTFISVAPHGP